MQCAWGSESGRSSGVSCKIALSLKECALVQNGTLIVSFTFLFDGVLHYGNDCKNNLSERRLDAEI